MSQRATFAVLRAGAWEGHRRMRPADLAHTRVEPRPSTRSVDRPADRLLARLSRRTSGGRFIPEIDGLRFVSITLVLLFHVTVVLGVLRYALATDGPFGAASRSATLPGVLASVLSRGGVGGDLFFIVSGFVLALPFIARAGG